MKSQIESHCFKSSLFLSQIQCIITSYAFFHVIMCIVATFFNVVIHLERLFAFNCLWSFSSLWQACHKWHPYEKERWLYYAHFIYKTYTNKTDIFFIKLCYKVSLREYFQIKHLYCLWCPHIGWLKKGNFFTKRIKLYVNRKQSKLRAVSLP